MTWDTDIEGLPDLPEEEGLDVQTALIVAGALLAVLAGFWLVGRDVLSRVCRDRAEVTVYTESRPAPHTYPLTFYAMTFDGRCTTYYAGEPWRRMQSQARANVRVLGKRCAVESGNEKGEKVAADCEDHF